MASQTYKFHRLVETFHEGTRLLAHHHRLIAIGVECTHDHQKKAPNQRQALYIAVRYKIQFYDEYWLLGC